MTTKSMPGLATAGFARAFEQSDESVQLSWYADHAEVSVVDWGQPTRTPHMLLGKSTIAGWVSRTCSDHRSVHVVCDMRLGDDIVLIAECRKADGTLCIYSCTAQLQGGLIVRQQVVLL